jgi:hypothetical protein
MLPKNKKQHRNSENNWQAAFKNKHLQVLNRCDPWFPD